MIRYQLARDIQGLRESRQVLYYLRLIVLQFVPTLFMRFDVDLVPGTALEEFCG